MWWYYSTTDPWIVHWETIVVTSSEAQYEPRPTSHASSSETLLFELWFVEICIVLRIRTKLFTQGEKYCDIENEMINIKLRTLTRLKSDDTSNTTLFWGVEHFFYRFEIHETVRNFVWMYVCVYAYVCVFCNCTVLNECSYFLFFLQTDFIQSQSCVSIHQGNSHRYQTIVFIFFNDNTDLISVRVTVYWKVDSASKLICNFMQITNSLKLPYVFLNGPCVNRNYWLWLYTLSTQ